MNKQDIQTVLDALHIVDSCVGLKNYFHDKPDGTERRLDRVVDDAIAILQAALAEPSEPVGTFRLYEGVYEHMADSYTDDDAVKLFTHPAPMPEPLTDEEIYALTTKLVKALDEIERLKPLAEVGRAMVEMTTTVHGADEWDVIPELWRMCMAERDIARADNKRKDAALRVALDALNHVAGKGKRCEAAITAINEALA